MFWGVGSKMFATAFSYPFADPLPLWGPPGALSSPCLMCQLQPRLFPRSQSLPLLLTAASPTCSTTMEATEGLK